MQVKNAGTALPLQANGLPAEQHERLRRREHQRALEAAKAMPSPWADTTISGPQHNSGFVNADLMPLSTACLHQSRC